MSADLVLKRFSIWADMYVADGEGHAVLLGRARGHTFREACANLAKSDQFFANHFDPSEMTHLWSRMFPGERSAIASFWRRAGVDARMAEKELNNAKRKG